MNTYLVTKHVIYPPLTIEAKTSDQAKRLACHIHGVRPSDYFCGISCYQAKKIQGGPQ